MWAIRWRTAKKEHHISIRRRSLSPRIVRVRGARHQFHRNEIKLKSFRCKATKRKKSCLNENHGAWRYAARRSRNSAPQKVESRAQTNIPLLKRPRIVFLSALKILRKVVFEFLRIQSAFELLAVLRSMCKLVADSRLSNHNQLCLQRDYVHCPTIVKALLTVTSHRTIFLLLLSSKDNNSVTRGRILFPSSSQAF